MYTDPADDVFIITSVDIPPDKNFRSLMKKDCSMLDDASGVLLSQHQHYRTIHRNLFNNFRWK